MNPLRDDFMVGEAQQATLAAIERVAEWHDSDGGAWQHIAIEEATGDPVIFIYDRHEAFILRSNGDLEISPEPSA